MITSQIKLPNGIHLKNTSVALMLTYEGQFTIMDYGKRVK